jgi:hypothetical protein
MRTVETRIYGNFSGSEAWSGITTFLFEIEEKPLQHQKLNNVIPRSDAQP